MRLKKLLENPDHVKLPNKMLTTQDSNANAFGYYKGKLYVGAPRILHAYIVPETTINPNTLKFSGRIWIKDKIVSFWDYPNKSQMRKVITDLEHKLGIRIWSDRNYRLELAIDSSGKIIRPTGTFWSQGKENSVLIPLKDYEGGYGIDLGDDAVKRHLLSPVAKSSDDIPAGIGSKKQPSDIRKGETMAQYHYRKQQESKKMSKLKDLLPEEFLTEAEPSPWGRQNVRDMNTVISHVNSLKNHIEDANRELDAIENVWFGRRDITWPKPLDDLLTKGKKVGVDYINLSNTRNDLKQIDSWLDSIGKIAEDLLKDLAKGKY